MSKARALGVVAGLAMAGQVLAVGQVSGKYVGNGKEAKLVHAVIVPYHPPRDVPTYTVVLSEKDPSASKAPDDDAMFDRLGDAITLSVTDKGDAANDTTLCPCRGEGVPSAKAARAAGFTPDARAGVQGQGLQTSPRAREPRPS